MKQLFYTSCLPGRSVSGRGGFQIRSVTPSLGPAQRRCAIRYAGYQLPASMLDSETLTDMPIRLALLDTPDLGLVLCHTAYVGKDPSTGREGNIFSHVLTGVAGVTARSAILSWGHDDWVCADGDFSAELPEVDQISAAGRLSDSGAIDFLANKDHRALLRFALTALLTTEEHQRIFLAAHGSTVAWIVYCLTRMLPAQMTADLTFSTFELDPLNTRARLIGSWQGRYPQNGLPDACYNGSSVGYNPRTGRKSTLQPEPTYVEFAVGCFAEGNLPAIDEVLDACIAANINQAQTLELVYRIRKSDGDLSDAEFRAALRHPELSPIVLKSPDAVQQLFAWAIEDANEVGRIMTSLRNELSEAPTVLDELVVKIRKALQNSVRTSQWNRVDAALDVVLAGIAPQLLVDALGDVTDNIDDATPAEWSILQRMLGRLWCAVESENSAHVSALFDRWIDRCDGQVGQIVLSELPTSVKVAVCVRYVQRRGATESQLCFGLRSDPDLFLKVFVQLASSSGTDGAAISIAEGAVGLAVADGLIDQLIAGVNCISPQVKERCIEVMLLGDSTYAGVLAQYHGDSLVRRLRNGRCLGLLVSQLLSHASLEILTHKHVQRLLHGLGSYHELNSGTKERLSAWITVESFLRTPSLERRTLQAIVASLQRLPAMLRDEIATRIPTIISNELIRKSSLTSISTDLEDVLRWVGPLYPGGGYGLFSHLLKQWSKNRAVRKRPRLVKAIARVGLAGGSLECSRGQQVEVIEFLRQFAGRARYSLFRSVDDDSRLWPKEAQTRWKEVASEIRPKTLREHLRFWRRFGAIVLAVALSARLMWFWSR